MFVLAANNVWLWVFDESLFFIHTRSSFDRLQGRVLLFWLWLHAFFAKI